MKKRATGPIEKIKQYKNAITSSTAVELHYGSIAYICGCKRITEYAKNRITLVCKDTTVKIEGEGLNMENLINGQLAVCGNIIRMEFSND